MFMKIEPDISRHLKNDLRIPNSHHIFVLSDQEVTIDGRSVRQAIAVEEISSSEYRLFAARYSDDDGAWFYPGEISVFNVDGTEDWLRPEEFFERPPIEVEVERFAEDVLRH